jgi:hypothetical protein
MRKAGFGVGLVAAVVLSTGPAGAADVRLPSPRHAPSEPAWGSYYPQVAGDAGIEGKSWVLCSITVEGDVQDCKIDRQTPPGLGFSEAALKYAPVVWYWPKTVDGVPVPSQATILINWQLPEEDFPRVLAKPSDTLMLNAYPGEARQAGRDGRASIECEVPEDSGALRDCINSDDPPTDDGFSQAALALGPTFRVAYCKPTGGLFRRKLPTDRVKLNFFWFAPRASGPSAGPALAIFGLSSNWRSPKYNNAWIERSAC